MRLWAYLLACLACNAPQALQAQDIVRPAQDVALRIDSLLARFLAEDGPSGVSVAVTRGRDTVVFGGWGLADRESSLAATAATSYRIGSITKQFTAAAVLKLVDAGHLELSDAIRQHLPQLPVAWRDVTITQLLNHTSGVPEITRGGNHWELHSSDIVVSEEMIAILANDRMDYRPGTRYRYSNTGYLILGVLLEKLHGRPYAEIVHDELAAPLALTRTRFCEDASGANGQAHGYLRKGGEFRHAAYRSIARAFSAGGMCSTIGDLVKWNRALHGGRVVSSASYALMTTPQSAATSSGYGFGLFVQQLPQGRSIVIHGGSTFDFRSVTAWIPSAAITVTVLTNTQPLETIVPLTSELVRLALGIQQRPR